MKPMRTTNCQRLTIYLFLIIALAVSACANGEEAKETDTPFSDASKDSVITVLSYNIHHANPPGREGVIDIQAVADVINKHKPDFVALQEVDVYTERSGKSLHQAKELARLTEMHFFFAKAIDHEGGKYGDAVLSRFPILDSTAYLLPVKEELGGEIRTVAAVTVDIPPHGKIVFASTHLDHKYEENRMLQASKVIEAFKDETLPVILAGDFNAVPGSNAIDYFDEYFKRTCQQNCAGTIPVNEPDRTIDFIMFNPDDAFKVVSHQVLIKEKTSDHLPVIAELTLKE